MNNSIKILTGSALCTVLYKIISSLSENSFNAQYMEELPLKSDEELEKLAKSKNFYKSVTAKVTLMQRKTAAKEAE